MAEPRLSLDPMTISEAPATTRVMPADERIFVASQWQLMWWRFRKHKLAMVSGIVVIGFYLTALGADFLAYADPNASEAQRSLMPPQPLYFFDGWRFSPHVYAVKGRRDPMTFKRVYQVDATQKIPVRFFARGFEYKFLGFIPTTIHLLGVDEGMQAEKAIFLLGTDVQGRDLWSRLLYATRISMTIGLVGVTLSLFLGVLLGGFSGFYGGVTDTVIQRLIEILRSIPTIPLWMGLAAALPREWSILQVYFAITIIISLLGWTELARVVRGRFLALREEDFVVSADADYFRAYGAIVHEPYHRRHDPGTAGDDHQRDGSQFSGPGSAPAGDQLGGSATASAERANRGDLALADAARAAGDHRRPGL
jgi:peptide/nickel transport system permease protein